MRFIIAFFLLFSSIAQAAIIYMPADLTVFSADLYSHRTNSIVGQAIWTVDRAWLDFYKLWYETNAVSSITSDYSDSSSSYLASMGTDDIYVFDSGFPTKSNASSVHDRFGNMSSAATAVTVIEGEIHSLLAVDLGFGFGRPSFNSGYENYLINALEPGATWAGDQSWNIYVPGAVPEKITDYDFGRLLNITDRGADYVLGSSIPEPSAFIMLLSGLIGFAKIRSTRNIPHPIVE